MNDGIVLVANFLIAGLCLILWSPVGRELRAELIDLGQCGQRCKVIYNSLI